MLPACSSAVAWQLFRLVQCSHIPYAVHYGKRLRTKFKRNVYVYEIYTTIDFVNFADIFILKFYCWYLISNYCEISVEVSMRRPMCFLLFCVMYIGVYYV